MLAAWTVRLRARSHFQHVEPRATASETDTADHITSATTCLFPRTSGPPNDSQCNSAWTRSTCLIIRFWASARRTLVQREVPAWTVAVTTARFGISKTEQPCVNYNSD